MKLNTNVKIEDAEARFSLSPAGPGIYYAKLIRFEGSPELKPPSRIHLVRNVRQWSGSCENRNLLNSLGNVIDNVARNAPIFRGGFKRNRGERKHKSPEQ